MSKAQISIRMPYSMMNQLNNYAQQTGISKTEIIVRAITQYLGCTANVPLSQRIAEIERRVTQLEIKEKDNK